MRAVYRDGKWTEGHASPELLPQDLRELPSEIVTKEIDDVSKIHPLDPKHIKDDLFLSHVENLGKEQPQKFTPKEPGNLSQDDVDVVRLRVSNAVVTRELERHNKGEHVRLDQAWHLWFSENDIEKYELRTGEAPGQWDRKKRPHWLLGLDLNIYLDRLPPRIEDKIKSDKELTVKYNGHLKERIDEYNKQLIQESTGLVLP